MTTGRHGKPFDMARPPRRALRGGLFCRGLRESFPAPWTGQAERLACHWQPNAFCGLTPTPTLDGPRAEGQREKPGVARPRTLCGLLDFDMPLTKEEAIFSVIEPPTVPPLFALVSRCVGQMGAGRHPCPQNPASALVGAVWRKNETPHTCIGLLPQMAR